mmetsp:Transcript_31643/g.57573  ORF Transcript_31643/g.57573 Transcript_31643/m.57573 type:complete len:713 (-) Transcript_31643:120-2258(-)
MVPPRPSRKTPRLSGTSSPPKAAPREEVGFRRSRNDVDDLPSSFRCPLSGALLRDPVRTSDGHVFERRAIEDWFGDGNIKSPLTGLVLEDLILTPHGALQAAILTYLAHCEDPEMFNEDCPLIEEETIQEQPEEDQELEDIISGLQSQLSLANQDLAEEAHPAAAPRLQDDVVFARKVVLVATGSRDELSIHNDDDQSPLGQADSAGDPGELLPTPVSARLASPSSISGSKQDLHRDGGLLRVGHGLASSSASLQLAKNRSRCQVSTLSQSKARLKRDSRSPSPEALDQDDPVLQKSGPRHSSARSLNVPVPIPGRTRATPRRPVPALGSHSNGVSRPVPAVGSNSNGVSRNGVVSARERVSNLQSRARPGSPSGIAQGPASGRRVQVTASSRGPRASCGLLGAGRSRGSPEGSGHPSRRTSTTAATPPAPQGPVEQAPASATVGRASGRDAAYGLGEQNAGSAPEEVAKRADVAVDEAGRTLLMHAAREGDVSKVQRLLEQNYAVDATDACRCTALMYAATYGQADVARCLVRQLANVDAASQDCWTPLIAAAYNGHLRMAQLLLAEKASIDSSDERGWTSLMHVAFNGNNDTLRCLLDHRAKVEAQDADGRTALVYAAFNGHLENVKCLLARAEKVTLQSDPDQGDGPPGLALLFAASHGHVEVVRSLLEASAASKQTRQTALKLANENGHHAVVELLVRRSALDSLHLS